MIFLERIRAKVVKVADGDTLTALDGQELITVRLAFIDAPEDGQPFCIEARDALSRLVYGKTCLIDPIGHDRYGRWIAKVVEPKGCDVSAQLLSDGWAWYYDPKKIDENYHALEIKAKNEKRGIWRKEGNTPPWIWRKNHKN